MYGRVQHDLGRAPPALTPVPATEQEKILAWAAALPCGQFHPSWCLDAQWAPLIALCRAGAPAPRGVSTRTWAAFCAKARSCGVINFPSCAPGCLGEPELRTAINCLAETGGCSDAGYVERIANTPACPDVVARYSAEPVPACLPADQVELVQYWDTYGHRGPDRVKNGVVFAASRVGILDRMRSVPQCGAPQQSGGRPPPVLPDPPAVEQEPGAAYPEDPYAAPNMTEAAQPSYGADDSRRKWLIAGVAGAVLLGGVVLVTRKKRGS
jgi:hypothetical protein